MTTIVVLYETKKNDHMKKIEASTKREVKVYL